MEKIKILIVEDEALIAESMRISLTKLGYQVTGCFDNGHDAVESIGKEPPDLIILDIAIAGKDDGIDTAKKIGAVGTFPIIFLTNLHDEDTIRRAKTLRPANYLLKPFTESQMNVSIINALYNVADDKEAEPRTGSGESHHDLSGPAVFDDKLFIKNSKGVLQKYLVSDILFLKAERTYYRMYLENGEELLQTSDMKDIWNKINHPDFVKAHRSYVVNINKIGSIKGNVIVLGKHEITMTPEHKDEILRRFRIVK